MLKSFTQTPFKHDMCKLLPGSQPYINEDYYTWCGIVVGSACKTGVKQPNVDIYNMVHSNIDENDNPVVGILTGVGLAIGKYYPEINSTNPNIIMCLSCLCPEKILSLQKGFEIGYNIT